VNCYKSKNHIFVIAEIGGNHEGDFAYAKELTRLAAESGVDAVKFQIYTGNTLVNVKQDQERNKHFKKFELKQQQYIELAEYCQKLGVMFMASVWNYDAFAYIDPYIQIYKVGSGDLTAYNFISRMVKTGKPIILSTGLATLDEALASVKFIERLDESYLTDNKLALLQCTSMYPIPDEDANLNVMHTFLERTGLPVGYSDHTVGMLAVEVAVSMGANIIEMHFTDSREGKQFRDHKVSATKDEIINFIDKVGRIKTLQGSFEKKPTPSEIKADHRRSFRRAVYPVRDIPKGFLLSDKDLITLRPCHGVGAESFYDMCGTKTERELLKGEKLERP
jgi:N,N'-diacetyllegionaminate synthase